MPLLRSILPSIQDVPIWLHHKHEQEQILPQKMYPKRHSFLENQPYQLTIQALARRAACQNRLQSTTFQHGVMLQPFVQQLCMQKAISEQPYEEVFKQYLITQLRVPAERIRMACAQQPK